MTEDSGHSKKFDSTSFNTSLKDVGLLVVEGIGTNPLFQLTIN